MVRIVPVVDAHRGHARLQGPGGIPHVVGPAEHDVAVRTPPAADPVAQIRQARRVVSTHQQFGRADAARTEKEIGTGYLTGVDDIARGVELLDGEYVPAARSRSDVDDGAQRPDGDVPGSQRG